MRRGLGCRKPARVMKDALFLNDFSAHADGERRGLDRIGGQRRRCLGATRLQVPSARPGSSAFAVGMLRNCQKNALFMKMCVIHGCEQLLGGTAFRFFDSKVCSVELIRRAGGSTRPDGATSKESDKEVRSQVEAIPIWPMQPWPMQFLAYAVMAYAVWSM